MWKSFFQKDPIGRVESRPIPQQKVSEPITDELPVLSVGEQNTPISILPAPSYAKSESGLLPDQNPTKTVQKMEVEKGYYDQNLQFVSTDFLDVKFGKENFNYYRPPYNIAKSDDMKWGYIYLIGGLTVFAGVAYHIHCKNKR